MGKYLRAILGQAPAATPQSEPLDQRQARNSAGGYSYPVDDWTRLARCLILGAEGGSYYATERALTKENAGAVLRCIEADGRRTVDTIVAVTEAGRAPKHDPALFALALAAAHGDEPTRRLALAALPKVARIGTHLLHFAAYAEGLRGWGRGLRRAVADWYAMPAERLAFQALKYASRDGWSHRDLLRLTHAVPPTAQHAAIYHWIVKGWDWVGDEPHPDAALVQIWAAERLRRATTAAEVVDLIGRYRLPREVVPTDWLRSPEVWAALLADMPMTALIRNLATLTRVGLLTPAAEATERVVAQLGDAERLRRARVHPIAILAAAKTYASGRGVRGQQTWQPVREIVEALDRAFPLAFGNITPTGQRWLIGLDVSGSMGGGSVAGVPGLAPRDAAAALATIWVQTERQVDIVAFTGGSAGGYQAGVTRFHVGRGDSLASVTARTNGLPFGPTDCALPMRFAQAEGLAVDAFVILTDSETWFGDVHPMAALKEYRERTGIPAKLVVVGMVSNGFTIADPDDAGTLDVVGFDTAAPDLVGTFVAGDLLTTGL